MENQPREKSLSVAQHWNICLHTQDSRLRVGEVTQKLRALLAFAVDPGSVFSTHDGSHLELQFQRL